MEDALCEALGCDRIQPIGRKASGCISSGQGYETDSLGEVFVKVNRKEGSDVMCLGEYASLQAMEATNAILVPHPIKALELKPYGWALITSFIRMDGRGSRDMSTLLAENLAKMHLHNAVKLGEARKRASFVDGEDDDATTSQGGGVEQFGFDLPTCCGFIPQLNDWQTDWATFFVRQRLKPQVDRILQKGDRDMLKLWPELERKAALILKSCDGIVPSLVHGDLWSGNWSTTDKEPVIFDPASFYADPEYEQGIMNMFGGFDSRFWKRYHEIIPKRPGADTRVLLYELFHHLNHWNHFGSSYKGSSLGLINQVLNS